MTNKCTPWFPGHIKPVRQGVYQLKNKGAIGYQRWDGQMWHAWRSSPDDAAKVDWVLSDIFQNDPWRGLKKQSA